MHVVASCHVNQFSVLSCRVFVWVVLIVVYCIVSCRALLYCVMSCRIVENASNFVYHRLKRWSVFVNSDKSATYVCFYNTFIKNAIFSDFFWKNYWGG